MISAPFKCFVASLLAAYAVNGHGYLTNPKAAFLTSSDPTQFVATIESSTSGLSGKFDGTTVENAAAFTTAFESSEYASLKDLINAKATIAVPDATLTCGSCDPNTAPQPLPESTVEWSHSDTDGFTPSHIGPCEVWCDDVRTFHDDDCATHFTTAPAQLPYDRDACMGSKVLSFYWLAMQSSTWQVYVSCAPLEETTGTGATSKFAVVTPGTPGTVTPPFM